ncbi:hypothetical protein M422DRAFT_249918, partial [Sphaerobolus stellatus SS14]
IPYVSQPEFPATDAAKERKSRPLLPRPQAQKLAANGGARLTSVCTRKLAALGQIADILHCSSPDYSRLHVLASTIEIRSRASSSSQPLPLPVSSSTPKTPLSPQTSSAVEDALLPSQVDPETSRWIAPLTLLQTPVRRNTILDRHWRQDVRPIESDLLPSVYGMRYVPMKPCLFTLGAGIIANPPPTTLSTPSSVALSHGPVADTLLTLQFSLHRVIIGTMGERTLQPNSSIAGGTGPDGPIQSAQAVPKPREAMLKYVSKIFAFFVKARRMGDRVPRLSKSKHLTPSTFTSPRSKSNTTT